MLFFYGIWMLCHHGQSPKKGEKSKQRFLGYNEKTHFPFVKSARKPRNVSFLTQNPRFLRIVGYPAAGGRGGTEKEEKEEEKEKSPHMCESISHRPLRGPCPKRRNLDIE